MWKDVKEAPKDKYIDVCISRGKEIYRYADCKWNSEYQFWQGSDGDPIEGDGYIVTHFMEIPELPKLPE